MVIKILDSEDWRAVSSRRGETEGDSDGLMCWSGRQDGVDEHVP